ncbi:MAG: ribonuclease D, partial [Rhodospirillales bacterium]|nr:ribonuclease D [Rhodospirillales bacterium]
MSTTQFMPNGTIHLHRHDLPDGLSFGASVAVDTETMGLQPHRDRLCLVQLSAGDGHAHLVQLIPPALGGRGYDCPNLARLLADPGVVKLMHFARFDVAVLQHNLGITVAPVRCTKIAAKLVRTFTDRFGLKDLCRELLGVELSKQQQSSDWGAPELTPEQLAYAASDVLYLHALWTRLEALLVREGRLALAMACIDFLPTRGR